MDIVTARRFREAQREAVWNVGEPFHRKRAARQVIEAVINHVQRGEHLVDTHFQAGDNVAALLAMHFHRQQTVAHERVIGAGVTGVTAGANHRADVTEVTGDFRIQAADTDGALFHVRGAQQNIHQVLHVTAHLLRQLTGLDHVVFQEVTTDTANQVQAVGFTRAGQDFRHFHGGFTNAEELHKAGVEAGEVARQAEVQQVRVQTLNFQQNRTNHLRTFRYHDAHRVLDGGGIRGAVGKAADAAHAVRQERHFVITHAGFRQFFHAAVDIEQTVVGVDDVLAVNEQAEVARFIGSNVQRANWHHVVFLGTQLVDELVGFGIGGRCRALTVVHTVFTQRVQLVRPIIRQHQTTFVGQAHRAQAVHVTHFALAPDRRRNARRYGRVFKGVRVNFNAHGNPALGAFFHRQHVVDRIVSVQFTFIVAEQYRQPAALLVVKKLDDFRQVVHLHGNR